MTPIDIEQILSILFIYSTACVWYSIGFALSGDAYNVRNPNQYQYIRRRSYVSCALFGFLGFVILIPWLLVDFPPKFNKFKVKRRQKKLSEKYRGNPIGDYNVDCFDSVSNKVYSFNFFAKSHKDAESQFYASQNWRPTRHILDIYRLKPNQEAQP